MSCDARCKTVLCGSRCRQSICRVKSGAQFRETKPGKILEKHRFDWKNRMQTLPPGTSNQFVYPGNVGEVKEKPNKGQSYYYKLFFMVKILSILVVWGLRRYNFSLLRCNIWTCNLLIRSLAGVVNGDPSKIKAGRCSGSSRSNYIWSVESGFSQVVG